MKLPDQAITIVCLIVIVAATYVIAKWPEKTDEQVLQEYYAFTMNGLACVVHRKPYALVCAPKMVGS